MEQFCSEAVGSSASVLQPGQNQEADVSASLQKLSKV